RGPGAPRPPGDRAAATGLPGVLPARRPVGGLGPGRRWSGRIVGTASGQRPAAAQPGRLGSQGGPRGREHAPGRAGFLPGLRRPDRRGQLGTAPTAAAGAHGRVPYWSKLMDTPPPADWADLLRECLAWRDSTRLREAAAAARAAATRVDSSLGGTLREVAEV